MDIRERVLLPLAQPTGDELQIDVAPLFLHRLLFETVILLWRRFDDVLVFRRPSVAQLAELLTMKLRGVRKPSVDVQALAAAMEGFTFADAERVCHEAIKAMVLAGAKELPADLLRTELAEQRARLRDVRTVTPSE